LNCTGCGYDLRSLEASGDCPECGQPIAVSEHDQTVARPQWLATIGGGAFLIGLGLLTGVAGVILATLVGRLRSPTLLLVPIGVAISGIGTWRFAAPTPRLAGPHGRWGATLLRVVGVATCTLQLQLCVVSVAALTERLQISATMLATFVRILLVAWSMAAGLTCLRAAYVAAQVRDRSGAIQARILSVLTPLMLLAFVWWTNSVQGRQPSGAELIGWTVGACVMAGWSGVFFSGLAMIIRRRAFG
jgi:hypothetical protein